MKILCVTPYYYPAFQFGGPVVSVHGLNKALIRNGVEVSVYTTNAGLRDKVPVNREVEVDGVSVTYFELAKGIGVPGFAGWYFSFGITRALSRYIPDYDLVYINVLWSYPASAASYYSRRYQRPYVIASRGMLYSYTMGKKFWKKWPYYQLILKRDLSKASAVHYTTLDEVEQCHARLQLTNKALVVPNGINPDTFQFHRNTGKLKELYPLIEGKKVILFLGRVHWIKGIDVLVKAYGSVARHRNDVHLLIVGPDIDGYQKDVQSWLEQEKLPSYSENFGMVVVEAMACGLPVIISENVGICDDVRNSDSGIVIAADPGQLTQALSLLLDEPALGKEMGDNGQALVRGKYAWEGIANPMISAFSEIINTTE